MGILSHALTQDAQIISTTVDRHGDQVPTATTSLKCRFRYITEIDRQNHGEGMEANDAIVWFEPSANVVEGTIIVADNKYWRVTRLIKARRLQGDEVHFLKGFVKRHELEGSIS